MNIINIWVLLEPLAYTIPGVRVPLTQQLLFENLPFLYQRTPLYIAAKEGYAYTVDYLLQKEANANMTANDGVSMWKNQSIQII